MATTESSRESLNSSPVLEHSEVRGNLAETNIEHLPGETGSYDDTDEEKKEEGELSVGNSVSMTPLLNFNHLMK